MGGGSEAPALLQQAGLNLAEDKGGNAGMRVSPIHVIFDLF